MLGHGKSSSYIPTSIVIRSCSYELISLKTCNAVQSSISNEMKIYINEIRIHRNISHRSEGCPTPSKTSSCIGKEG